MKTLRTLALLLGSLIAIAPDSYAQSVSSKGGPTAPDGTEAICDFPKELHQRNTTSRGQGCCTWKSLSHAAEWQNVPAYRDSWKWIQENGIHGGASPSDFARNLPQIARDRGFPEPAWLQYSGPDMSVLDLAFRTGRMPCITYGSGHMVNAVHLDRTWGAFLDNNVPGFYLWHPRAEFERIAKAGGRHYWCVVLLDAPPPPPPSPSMKKRTWTPACDCGCGCDPCECEDCPCRCSCEQCPGGNCAVPRRPAGDWDWRQDVDAPNWYGLFRDGQQVGAFNATTGIYRPYHPSTGRWGVPRIPPVPPPGSQRNVPYGCNRELPERETFWLNGKVVSRGEAIQALEDSNGKAAKVQAGTLVDDSGWLRATVIGPREQVAKAMHGLRGGELQGKPILWQGYEPNDWPVRDVGFKASAGEVTVYLQGPDGQVYSRTAGYPGPVRFAKAVEKAEALRRVNPAYDDAKAPDLTQPDSPLSSVPVPNLPGFVWTQLAACAGISTYTLLGKGQVAA